MKLHVFSFKTRPTAPRAGFICQAAGAYSVAFLAALTTSWTALAAAPPLCAALFNPEQFTVAHVDLETQLAAAYANPSVIEAYKNLKQIEARPRLTTGTNQILIIRIKEILKDEELSVFHLRLNKVLAAVRVDLESIEGGTQRAESSEDQLLRQLLIRHVSAEIAPTLLPNQVRERVEQLSASLVTKQGLMTALGGLSAKESTKALVGAGGLRHLDPHSIVGQFLTASARLGVQPATLVGTFPAGPEGAARGNERLFISIDRRNMELADQVFGKNPHLLAHNHMPKQGTLMLQHMGEVITYAKYMQIYSMGYFRALTGEMQLNKGTIIPLITLSTTEASRTKNYFELGRMTNSARSKYPWSLKEENGESYCRPGGYTSCTHWVGEMPVGDRLVSEYSFPGQPDAYATQNDLEARDPRDLRSGPVGRYENFDKGGRDEPIGVTSRLDRLTRLVWKQTQGHEQLWSVLNLKRSLESGELANPGWTLYALAAMAPTERVPVVLIYREDASVPLTQTEIDELRSQVQAY